MTDIDPIEQRLRRTFQAVAEQPVAPLGDPEPWRHTGAAPPRRRGRVLVGGLAVVVVVALVALGVTYGPRSSRLTPTTLPGLSGTPGGTLRAVFTPATPVSSAMLEEAAATMAARLHAVGDTGARATVDGGSIDIASPKFAGVQMQLIGSMGSFSVRPVGCGAPADTTPAQPATTGTTPPADFSPACEAQYETSASNLDVNTTTGQPAHVIGPDPIFASTPSTPAQDDEPAHSVLLPADPVVGAQEYPRFVLGAAQLGNVDIASAQARSDQSVDGWVIDVTLTPSGTTDWNAMALPNFHAYVALDLDGQVISAPLIEPNNSSFSSFGDQMEISGTFTAATAKTIAAVLGNGPLPVPFTLLSQETTP
jgi:preprotein translocase subunit SecD